MAQIRDRHEPITRHPATCPACLAWTAELGEIDRANDAALTDQEADALLARGIELDCHLHEHEVLHGLVAALWDIHDPWRDDYLHPEWDYDDGRALLREPGGGTADQSRGFYVAHRHWFGGFVSATYGGTTGLRLYDDKGQVLELHGCGVGCLGERTSATLWLLRQAGFTPPGLRGDWHLAQWVQSSETLHIQARWAVRR